jgi:hypothetical protein
MRQYTIVITSLIARALLRAILGYEWKYSFVPE